MARKMKDSGIEWIGEIPEDWELIKVKHLFNVSRGRVISKLEIDEKGKYPVYSSQTENNGIFGYLDTYDYSGEALTWTTDGYAGTVFYRNGKYNCTNICGVLQKKETSIFKTDIKFLYYAIKMVAKENKRPDINGYKIMSNEMGNFSIPITDYESQKHIGEELDCLLLRINEINKIISQQIQTLKDYKKSVITEAVTKGLDKSVEMKDSGIEWIGEIPKHWEVVPARYLFKANKKIVGRKENEYERLSLTMKGILKKSKYSSEGLQPSNFNNYQILTKNQLVFKLIDLQNISTSRVGISPYKGIVSPAYIIIDKKDTKTNNRFYYYWYMSMYLNKVFNLLGNAGVRSNINATELLELKVPRISFREQNIIVNFLDKKTKLIDDLIVSKQKQLEILEEHKKSLIYEYVTGKKEA